LEEEQRSCKDKNVLRSGRERASMQESDHGSLFTLELFVVEKVPLGPVIKRDELFFESFHFFTDPLCFRSLSSDPTFRDNLNLDPFLDLVDAFIV
jgi:hypothetical protein